MRGDVQEPDLRCGTFGTSGHVTTKSSIRNWDVLYKSGVYALTALCLTPGGLHGVLREGMVEILWHRRETSRQTEKTKFHLKPPMGLRYRQRYLSVMQESAEGIVGGEKQAYDPSAAWTN